MGKRQQRMLWAWHDRKYWGNNKNDRYAHGMVHKGEFRNKIVKNVGWWTIENYWKRIYDR